MDGDPIRALTGRRRTRPTSPGCRNPQQPKPGRTPLIAVYAAVQINRATSLVLPDQLTTQASALLHGRGHREPKSETFEPRWRNHLETQDWQKTSINLGLGTGCGPAFVQSLLIGSCAVPMFLKPLIGFTTSTSLLTGLMVVFSHVG